MAPEPNQVARQFFQSLMHNQCQVCWKLFTKKSQAVFLKWTVNDIYQRHSQAANYAKLGASEVKLLFENNDVSLMKTFWKRFFFASRANEMFRYGYFNLKSNQGKKAIVEVDCRFPNGQQVLVELVMVYEHGSWKFGYIESKLPF